MGKGEGEGKSVRVGARGTDELLSSHVAALTDTAAEPAAPPRTASSTRSERGESGWCGGCSVSSYLVRVG